MPNRLTDLEITEVSFVDRPANPESKIMLFKRDTSSTSIDGDFVIKNTPSSEDVLVPHVLGSDDEEDEKKKRKKKRPFEEENLEKSEGSEYPHSDSPERNTSMPDEDTFSAEYVAKLEDKVLDLEDRLSAVQAENEALAKRQEPQEEDILKSADPAIRELVEKAHAEAEEAKALAKAERQARIHREYIDKAEKLGGLTIEKDELADLLIAVNEQDSELGSKLERVLAAANEAAEVGKLYAEVGSNEITPNSAEESIHKAALAKSESEGISYERAYDEVLATNPELYGQVLNEGGR